MGEVGVEEWGVWKGSLGQVPKVWPHSSLSHGCPFTGHLPTQGGLLKGLFVNRGDLIQDGWCLHLHRKHLCSLQTAPKVLLSGPWSYGLSL